MKQFAEIKKYNVYKFVELSNEAKETVKQWYLDGNIENDMFYENTVTQLNDMFPSSNLDVEYSLANCQGDGLNIVGTFNMTDYLPYYTANQKSINTVKFYLTKIGYNFQFSKNNHYCYSCKFIDKKYIDCDIDEYVECLHDVCLRDINKDVIADYFHQFIDYMDDFDTRLESDGYTFLYDIDNADLNDICEYNGWHFLSDGTYMDTDDMEEIVK